MYIYMYVYVTPYWFDSCFKIAQKLTIYISAKTHFGSFLLYPKL